MKNEQAGPRRSRGGGRPPKFKEPRRPVTVTLPERTIGRLAEIDADRARAIVRAAERFHRTGPEPSKPVEIVTVGAGLAVIVVKACRPLGRISWLRTIEIAPDRFLLSILPGTPIEMLEVEITDLSISTDASDADRALLAELLEVLRTRRRARTIQKAEILFVEPVTEERVP